MPVITDSDQFTGFGGKGPQSADNSSFTDLAAIGIPVADGSSGASTEVLSVVILGTESFLATDAGESVFIPPIAVSASDTASTSDASFLRVSSSDAFGSSDASFLRVSSSDAVSVIESASASGSFLVSDTDLGSLTASSSSLGNPPAIGFSDRDWTNAFYGTPVTSSDSGTGTDMGAFVFTDTDLATGADSVVRVTLQSADDSQQVEALEISLFGQDQVSASEAETSAGTQVQDADGGTGASAEATAAALANFEAVTAVEDSGLAVTVQGGDAGSGAEVTEVTSPVSSPDTLTASESVSLLVRGTDVVASQEAAFLSVVSAEAGSGSDSQSFPGSTFSEDAASSVEAYQLTVHVANPDGGSASEGYEYNVPELTAQVTGPFSVLRAAILAPGGAESLQLFGCREGSIASQVNSWELVSDDLVTGSWFDMTDVQVTVTEGFLPFSAASELLGTPVSPSGMGTVPRAVPLFAQWMATKPVVSIALRSSARDAFGNPRVLDITLYAVRITNFSLDHQAYKTGFSVSWSGRAVRSASDERGAPLAVPAFGRLTSMPGILPEVPILTWNPVVEVVPSDKDFGSSAESASLGAATIQSADSLSALDGKSQGRVVKASADAGAALEAGAPATITQHISDPDTGSGAESAAVNPGPVPVADTDSFSPGADGEFPSGQTVSTDAVLRGGFITGRAALRIGAICGVNATLAQWESDGPQLCGANFPPDSVKEYYDANAMTTWQAGKGSLNQEASLPLGTLVVVCYGDIQVPSLAGYVASIPDDREVWMVYAQEAELNYPGLNHQLFVDTTIQCSEVIRSQGKANVKVATCSASSAYRSLAGTGATGKWLVPSQYVDLYLLDIYEHYSGSDWPSLGLQNYDLWHNWLNVFAGEGRPLGIAEYGIDNGGGTAVQASRMAQDAAYLRTAFPQGGHAATGSMVSPFPLALWEIWWSQAAGSGPSGYMFNDATCLSTWQSIMAGTT